MSKPKSEPNTGWPLVEPPEHRQFLQIFETFDVTGKQTSPSMKEHRAKKLSFVLIRTILVNTSHVKAFISETPMGVDETSMKEHVTNLITGGFNCDRNASRSNPICLCMVTILLPFSTVSETALI